MSLKADIVSIVEQYDQYNAQDVDDVELVMIDCQECEYHDSFGSVDDAELYLRGHMLVSRHYDIDIGVELSATLQEIDFQITVGETIESQ